MKVSCTLNGHAVEAHTAPGASLLELLRGLGAASVKDGCARGDCGSCAVLLDGRAVTACLLFAGQAEGHRITTAEGLADADGLHPLQQALLDAGGVQCGYCTPGVLMAAMDLLARTPQPTEEQVRVGLAGNLCRCTGYVKIVEGVLDAAAALRSSAPPGATGEDGHG
jgi:aerobic carbon-monoxide dehydrogenase small subunit